MGYTLTAPSISPQTPTWVANILPYLQATADSKYREALASYDAASVDWINANIINRSGSSDPAHFVPIPLDKAIPQREVYDGSVAGPISTFRTDMVSPPVHPPVLPAYVAPDPAGKIGSGAPSHDAQNDAILASLMHLILQMQSDVAAIKSRVGA